MKKNSLLFLIIIATSSYAQDVDPALANATKSETLLEGIEKKSVGLPNEHDILLRLIEAINQVDHLTKQKSGQSVTSSNNLKKIEYYSTRFVSMFPKDPSLYRVLSLRAKAFESEGKDSFMVRDLEASAKLAPPKSEDRLKVEYRLGEYYRNKKDFKHALNAYNSALNDATDEWRSYVLQTLMQIQMQTRDYSHALKTANELFAMHKDDESLIQQKGHIIAYLWMSKIIDINGFFKEINLQTDKRSALLHFALLDLQTSNREDLLLQTIQDSRFRIEETPFKLEIASELANGLYDQKALDSLKVAVTEMENYSAPEKPSANNDASVKRLTVLTAKLQKAVAKDPKLADSHEGQVLNALYEIIAKFGANQGAVVSETEYNKASLLLVQNNPMDAAPIFKKLGDFKDSKEKYQLSMMLELKLKKIVPEHWVVKKTEPCADSEALQELQAFVKTGCDNVNFQANTCFDALKGEMKSGVSVEKDLRQIIFEPKRSDADRSQAFSALFDYLQNNNQSDNAQKLYVEAQNKGVKLTDHVADDAKSALRSQDLAHVQKAFDDGQNKEVVSFVENIEKSGGSTIAPELFAYAALADQRMGKDEDAESYYSKYDHSSVSKSQSDLAFLDLVAVGHAIAAERVMDFKRASLWWGKVQDWKELAQKKLALNSIWIASDLNQFKKITHSSNFCSGDAAKVCEEYKNLFIATWPAFAHELSARSTEPTNVLEDLVQLQIQKETRLKWAMHAHDHWTQLEPVRQVALFPTFQAQMKHEIRDWTKRETDRFKNVNNLIAFQNALKAFKQHEDELSSLQKSNWTDFQIDRDVAIALVYESAHAALAKAESKDQTILSQDASVKKLFDQISDQLATKQKENMTNAKILAQGYSVDLSLFQGFQHTDEEWKAMADAKVKSSPLSFYSGLSGHAKNFKEHWLGAFKQRNWAKVGYTLVKFSSDHSIDSKIYQTFEAETYLRFGNRVDAQRTIASEGGASS